jgi:hypothetical protein
VAAQKERGAGAAWAQAAYLLVISLADYLLLATTRWLGRLEKHKTRTALEASIMVRTGRGVRGEELTPPFSPIHSTFIHFGSGGERGHFIQHSFISVRVGRGVISFNIHSFRFGWGEEPTPPFRHAQANTRDPRL